MNTIGQDHPAVIRMDEHYHQLVSRTFRLHNGGCITDEQHREIVSLLERGLKDAAETLLKKFTEAERRGA